MFCIDTGAPPVAWNRIRQGWSSMATFYRVMSRAEYDDVVANDRIDPSAEEYPPYAAGTTVFLFTRDKALPGRLHHSVRLAQRRAPRREGFSTSGTVIFLQWT